jgi:hypothetical protein
MSPLICVLPAIAEFVMHGVDHLLAPLGNYLHVYVCRRCETGVAHHALGILDRPLGLAQGGHGSPDYLKRQFR